MILLPSQMVHITRLFHWGAGDDVFDATSGVMGDSAYATVVNGEDGNDTFKLGTIAKKPDH